MSGERESIVSGVTEVWRKYILEKFAIVLAAGQGTRMKSKLYKVLHPICGQAMVEHVVDQLEALGVSEIVTVVGHGAEMVEEVLGDRVSYTLQEEQLGTAHAVMQARGALEGKEGTTLVICGDTPLLTDDTLQQLITYHESIHSKATVLTSIEPDPTGYGRIIRNEQGVLERIVEQKDAETTELAIKEVNTGTYCFDNKELFEALETIGNENAQGEFYLTDIIEVLKVKGKVVAGYAMPDAREGLGVNDRVALAKARKVMQERINHRLMVNGVTLVDPQTTYVDVKVEVGPDTVIEGNVSLLGTTKIGSDCLITSGSRISDSTIGDSVTVTQSVIEQATLDNGGDCGPFAHLRTNASLGENVHVGNFVEVKNATVGKDTKVGHLTYVGDADLGREINIGCGTIFVNYDGVNKHRSTVGDGAFIGCDTSIIAPVTIGKGAFTAAGSVITKDVPEKALAIARARQENKEKYANRLPHK